jgi:hypothetical protein
MCLCGGSAGFGAYTEDRSRFHEAGFDALITGVTYLRMAYHLGMGCPSLQVNHAVQRLSTCGRTWRVPYTPECEPRGGGVKMCSHEEDGGSG